MYCLKPCANIYILTTRAKPSTLNLILNATPSRNLENGPKQRRRKQRQKENPFGSHDKTKEEIIGMSVKRKEAKKNQEMDEAVDKKDSVEVGKDDKKPGKVDAEEGQDARIKSEDKKSGGEIFDEAIKIAHAEIVKKKKTERSGSGPAGLDQEHQGR